MNLTTALQTDFGAKGLQREPEFFSKRSDVHAPWFAQSEHSSKSDVRTIRDDRLLRRSQNASMPRAPQSAEKYDELRSRSGWYLGAWRTFRRLTLQDLATAMNTSRGQVSDLENGATNKRGVQTRYNRDWLELACAALDVSAGDLIDTNPLREEPRYAAVRRAFPDLNQDDLDQLVGFADVMRGRGRDEAA